MGNMRGTRWSGYSTLALAAAALIIGERRGSTGVVVTTIEVSAGTIQRRIVATGTLEAVGSVDVGTQVSGTVESLNVDVNSVVRSGQVLARLDSASVEAQVREAEAERSAADAALSGVETAADAARQNLSRAARLASMQMISHADLDAAEMAVDEANADVAAAESAVARAGAAAAQAATMRDRTIIRAPIDGIVVSRHVDVGQTVAEPSQAPVLFRLASDLKQMRMQITLDGSDVNGVHAGDPVMFEVAAYPGETFRGTVLQVLQPTSTGATAVNVAAIATVANADEQLRPGLTATAKLNGSRRDRVVRIPNLALSFRPPADVLHAMPQIEAPLTDDEGHSAAGTLKHVWKYDGKQFIDVTIHTGVADTEWTELITGTVQVGDRLVTDANLERRRRD
jgi:HlyD family secretion protein